MDKVIDTITIEKLEGGCFIVRQNDKYADGVTYDELLGLVSALTMPESRPCLHWLRTEEQHNAWQAKYPRVVVLQPWQKLLEAPKDILVPEEVEIWGLPSGVYSGYGDGLFIGFNDSKQLLGYSGDTYCVEPRHKCSLGKVICKLIPCEREDLKSGDTAFSNLINDFKNRSSYCKILEDSKVVFISSSKNNSARVMEWDEPSLQWYKVVPQ